MFARGTRAPAAHRRGVVLILVLAMLGLLAVIGVSFATFSGQARKGAYTFSKRINRPNIDELLESAVAQLINDTTNPMSALYGHGLLRDMYGNDASTNGFYAANPNGSQPTIAAATGTAPSFDAPQGWVVTTNIPYGVGRDFLYWTLTVPAVPGVGGSLISVAQTFQVVGQANVGGVYQFTLSGAHVVPVNGVGISLISEPLVNRGFTLDGRYRRAFNGRGMAGQNNVTGGLIAPAYTDPVIANGNTLAGQFANFRVSGGLLTGQPDVVAPFEGFDLLGVDEDYDAPDLENWFLAVQSADGSISVPSFHRPGILANHLDLDPSGNLTDMNYPVPSNYTSGTDAYRRSVRALSKILTLRSTDHPTANFPDLVPDATTGEIAYPVDNDGDGVPESVWLDLGFPPQRAEDGSLYKPLFSFMVVGLNGKLPLNTAGNLNARVDVDNPQNPPGIAYATTTVDEAGMPLFDHASHLGASPSEINPSFALQNGPPDTTTLLREWGVNTGSGNTEARGGHQQFDDAVYPSPLPPADSTAGTPYIFRHIPVSLTQLRNLLSGTRPYDLLTNGDRNTVQVTDSGGNPVPVNFANNVVNGVVTYGSLTFPDGRDALVSGGVDRSAAAIVAGRWGEPGAVTPTLVASNAPDLVVPGLLRALNYSSLNPVRAGRSPFAASQYRVDGIDDDYDTYDFIPPYSTAAGSNSAGGPEAGPVVDDGTAEGALVPSIARDGIGMPMVASERAQRDVTPKDTSGNGILSRFNLAPDPATYVPHNVGPDARGRVGFFHHFRPPGVPIELDDQSIDANMTDGKITERLIPLAGSFAAPSYVLADSRHNKTHGYESLRDPAGSAAPHMAAMPYNLSNANAPSYAPRLFDGTNYNAVPPTDLFAGGAYIGTMDETINSNSSGDARLIEAAPGASWNPPSPLSPVNSYPLVGGLQYNDPDEMNLYHPNRDDAPFGPHDLEWLYRQGDVDGQSLDSRLKDLAPISFVQSDDADVRRKLFADASWDRIEASFAHDNPAALGNVYNPTLPAASQPLSWPYLGPADPARAPSDRQRLPQYNARFPGNLSASIDAMTAKNTGLGVFTPQVFQGGRRINLNHPLPHSYNPFEPVRQKWITETYETLKLILPPQALDTPQEVAKLGQFVVNIVDFRDPDNAITIWQNPDIVHRPARLVGGVNIPPSIHLEYQADGNPDANFILDEDGDGNLDEDGDGLVDNRLTHYGMEFQPVALNEVLGFQSKFGDPASSGTATTQNYKANVLMIELVNTLTAAGHGSTASNLDLQGWDFILVREDAAAVVTGTDSYNPPAFVRPDPITGQTTRTDTTATTFIPPVRPEDVTTAPEPYQAAPVVVGTGMTVDPLDRATSYATGLTNPLVALQVDGDEERMVLRGFRTQAGPTITAWDQITEALDNDFDTGGSAPDNEFAANAWDLIPDTADPAFANPEGQYFWLYLRRPANPLKTPDPATNPMVVVDSIRFPYSPGGGQGQVQTDGSGGFETVPFGAAPSQPIYSIERPQPFRGGQIVPDPEDTTRPLFLYGNTVQALPATDNDGYGLYKTANASPTPVHTTVQIKQTINGRNRASDTDSSGGISDTDLEAWDYFPFNDRDFVGVAELMLVPACPPGLFTKQFVEMPPSVLTNAGAPEVTQSRTGTSGTYYDIPPTTAGDVPEAADDGVSGPYQHGDIRTYPYLAHEFYYSSDPNYAIDPQGLDTTIPDRVHSIGGPTAAGWHRMLEFFEVPAPTIDAIGPVARGINLDWFRQDRRPGLLNPNLIVDEEVFFGLVDDPRLLDTVNLQTNSFVAAVALPQVVTQVDINGQIANSTVVANRGYTAFSTLPTGSVTTPLAIDAVSLRDNSTSLNFPLTGMKVPFADFLKQRNGGSGFLFGYGDAQTAGYVQPLVGPVPPARIPRDRPYRSASYHDIQDTLMRPATLPPSPFTILPYAPTPPPGSPVIVDPGLKVSQTIAADNTEIDPGFAFQFDEADPTTFYANPVLDETAATRRPLYPGVPPRRLFQIPDYVDTGATPPLALSNAAVVDAENPDYTPITTGTTGFTGPGLSGTYSSLFPQNDYTRYLGATALTGTPPVPDPGPNVDMRRHPYYRTELIQKMSNLTTPRTHQFAVWLTVGFFEVAQSGDRAQLVPDVIGPEIGASSGSIVRNRAFFVIDRSKATGYDPRNPGDYRDVVVYSRRIE